MKIATWNVNSIRARLDRLLAWLERAQPDVVCLQELKVTDDAFPYEPIRQAGYHASVFGQKTYNGVAVLSKAAPADVQRGIPAFEDPQARLLMAQVDGIWIISAYVPNGDTVGSEKYHYKLNWLQRLQTYLEARFKPTDQLIVCGDFNVACDEQDVARPDAWADTVLFHQEVRAAMQRLLGWGLVDLVRQQHPEGGLYSWWDYRMLAFPKNDGLRIDYILATQALAQRCTAAEIDRAERKGEKPSDHAPVMTVLVDCRAD